MNGSLRTHSPPTTCSLLPTWPTRRTPGSSRSSRTVTESRPRSGAGYLVAQGRKEISMADKRLESDPRANGKGLDADPDLLDLVGGEQLEGSGFEAEIPELDFEWRDSR